MLYFSQLSSLVHRSVGFPKTPRVKRPTHTNKGLPLELQILMPLFLYTLELKENHFYVGTTTNPAARLKEHRDGAGAEWTRLHPPLCFSQKYKLRKLECSDEAARLQEDAHVKAVMLDRGIDSVRGGSYSRPHLSREDVKALCKEMYHATNGCLRCGHQGHWATACFARTDVMGNAIVDDDASPSTSTGAPTGPQRPRYAAAEQRAAAAEQRAAAAAESAWQGGRGGQGGRSGGVSPSASSTKKRSRNSLDGCRRCGRASHTIKDCYATSDVAGNRFSEEEESSSSDEDEDEDEDSVEDSDEDGG